MTKKLEEFLNLSPIDNADEGDVDDVINDTLPMMTEMRHTINEITTADKIDTALTTVHDLTDHDSEMDGIATKAISTFEDLMSIGPNVPDRDAGKIYEVAGQMLRIALDAKNSKTDKRLRMVELQLKKMRLEQTSGEVPSSSTRNEIDRNEILKIINAKVNEQKKT